MRNTTTESELVSMKTYNQIFIDTLAELLNLTVNETFTYIEKSSSNNSNFYKGKTLCFPPNVLMKPSVVEALKLTNTKWERLQGKKPKTVQMTDWE